MQHNARLLSEQILATGNFELVGEHHTEQLPLVAFRLTGERDYDEFDVTSQLAADRGWRIPALWSATVIAQARLCRWFGVVGSPHHPCSARCRVRCRRV